jgi:diguanylate cyclase (GGDEF)-like protein
MASASRDRPLARQLEELAAVHESLRALTSTLEFPDILRAVLDRIKAFTAAEGLSLLLYDAERDELVFAATETLAENALVGRGEPGTDRAARGAACTGGAVLADDGRILAVPLRRGGKVVGAVEVRARQEHGPFGTADAERIQHAADAAFAGIDPAGLSRDAGALAGFFAGLAAAVPNEATSLVLLDESGRELAFTASRTLRPGVIDGLRLSCDRGIAGWVARHREPVRLADASADPRHDSAIAGRTGLVPHSMLCVPVVKKDRLLGVIQVINKADGSAFTDDELRLVQTLADHAAIAIENASLYREARIAAITDDLTGLANTRYFNRMLPALMARARPLTLLVLDLDNFKALVDREGHLVGSRAISHVGRLIAARLRPADLAARFGGDEFVVVLPATPTAAARELAEAIRQAIAAARVLAPDGVDISAVTASIGLATYPDHADDAESLFRAADAAMYAVKRRGKNAVGIAP